MHLRGVVREMVENLRGIRSAGHAEFIGVIRIADPALDDEAHALRAE